MLLLLQAMPQSYAALRSELLLLRASSFGHLANLLQRLKSGKDKPQRCKPLLRVLPGASATSAVPLHTVMTSTLLVAGGSFNHIPAGLLLPSKQNAFLLIPL